MAQGPVRSISQRWTFWPSLVIVIAILVLTGVHYRQYLYSCLWHAQHGNVAEVADHRKLTLPVWWWAESDPDHYDTFLVKRAGFGTLAASEITFSPALKGTIHAADQEEMVAMRRVVSTINERSQGGSSYSFIVIDAKETHVYCSKQEPGPVPVDMVYCRAAGFSHSAFFTGSPAAEQEAEKILSSLE